MEKAEFKAVDHFVSTVRKQRERERERVSEVEPR